MDTTNVMVKLSIYGEELNPQIITDKLNIQPQEYWQQGDNITGKSIRRNKSCWRAGTGYQESLDINNQLSEIIDLFQGKTAELIELTKEYNLEIILSIVINIEDNQKPAMNITRQAVEFIYQIQAEIDIDLYVYS